MTKMSGIWKAGIFPNLVDHDIVTAKLSHCRLDLPLAKHLTRYLSRLCNNLSFSCSQLADSMGPNKKNQLGPYV